MPQEVALKRNQNLIGSVWISMKQLMPRALSRTTEQSSWQLVELNSWTWKKTIKRGLSKPTSPQSDCGHTQHCTPKRTAAEASTEWDSRTDPASHKTVMPKATCLSILTILHSNSRFICLYPVSPLKTGTLSLITNHRPHVGSCADPAINLIPFPVIAAPLIVPLPSQR